MRPFMVTVGQILSLSNKQHIALKKIGESIYWLTLLKRTALIKYDYDNITALAEEIRRMLIVSINTANKG